jgi:hypothetical protein
MKPMPIMNYVILFAILAVLAILYRRFEDKRIREENKDNYEAVQKYLLDDVTLGKSKKPILWIHVPYEYNSRKWLSFGSRSSFDLNQPYLYLTIKSIINQCEDSFTICIIDDNAFERLIPSWNINMNTVSDPIQSNMRTLGLMKLLYIYGGIICPISFVCLKDLKGLYEKGTRGERMFLCELTDRNITSTEYDYYPNLKFSGAPKECETVRELCDFIQRIMSRDYTAQSVFLGDFNRWCNKRIQNGRITMIDGVEIGTKTIEETPILIDHLMSNYYLDLYKGTYGIYIPADEILKRIKYEWFTRLSPKQVLESNTIVGNYLLLTNSPDGQTGILEPLAPSQNKAIKNEFVGFWRVPSQAPYYGLKPNFLGDNLQKKGFPNR